MTDAQQSLSDAQEEAEAERRRAKELENELRTSRLQAEIDKLRALETLREKFDAEREQLRDDRAQDESTIQGVEGYSSRRKGGTYRASSAAEGRADKGMK